MSYILLDEDNCTVEQMELVKKFISDNNIPADEYEYLSYAIIEKETRYRLDDYPALMNLSEDDYEELVDGIASKVSNTDSLFNDLIDEIDYVIEHYYMVNIDGEDEDDDKEDNGCLEIIIDVD